MMMKLGWLIEQLKPTPNGREGMRRLARQLALKASATVWHTSYSVRRYRISQAAHLHRY